MILCTNKHGQLVLKGTIWHRGEPYPKVLTIYGYTGIRRKRQEKLKRAAVKNALHTPETLEVMLDNMALLWAMEHGVSDFVFVRRDPSEVDLYHPSELEACDA